MIGKGKVDRAADEALMQVGTMTPRRRWTRRVAVAGGVSLLAVAVGLLLSPASGSEYVTAEMRKGNLIVSVTATGRLAPTTQVSVGSELSGIVSRVLVESNDRVTKGQVLAELDPSKLDDAVLRSQAALEVAESNVRLAEAQVHEMRLSLSRLQEVSRLSGGKVPAKAEMERAEVAFVRAQAQLQSAKAEVARGRAQLSSDQTDRAKAAIRSPIDGVVLARQVELGQTVAASFQTPVLFVLAEDLTQMKLEVSVDEADVGQVKEGQQATFTVDAFPNRPFPARIVRVNLGAKAGAGTATQTQLSTPPAGAVVTYAAVLEVANPDGSLRPGMTATATIVTGENKDVLLVPSAALRFRPGRAADPGASGGLFGALLADEPLQDEPTALRPGVRHTLYVEGGDGRPRRIDAVVGASNGRYAEVTGDGLRPGLAVIVGRLAVSE